MYVYKYDTTKQPQKFQLDITLHQQFLRDGRQKRIKNLQKNIPNIFAPAHFIHKPSNSVLQTLTTLVFLFYQISCKCQLSCTRIEVVNIHKFHSNNF